MLSATAFSYLDIKGLPGSKQGKILLYNFEEFEIIKICIIYDSLFVFQYESVCGSHRGFFTNLKLYFIDIVKRTLCTYRYTIFTIPSASAFSYLDRNLYKQAKR